MGKAADYKRTSERGGGGRLLQAVGMPGRRTPRNERDLSLAMFAQRKIGAGLASARMTNGDVQGLGSVLQVLKGIVWNLRGSIKLGMSPRQMDMVLKILHMDAAPPLPDPIPAACKVLPLKPPGRGAA